MRISRANGIVMRKNAIREAIAMIFVTRFLVVIGVLAIRLSL